MPSELTNATKPIVGYYGAISDWFDVELAVETAKAHPDKTFVLVGHVWNVDVSSLKELKNILLLGRRPYEELPSYLQCFDVCFIPFKETALTVSTNPVKVYEMLSAGKPVVAIDIPELREMQNLVYIARGKAEFVSKIDQALFEKKDSITYKRKQYALSNTWDKRFQVLLSEISSLYEVASIVIVAHNNKDLTQACLDSIFENTTYPCYEVIVVDNGSTDGTARMLTDMKQKHPNMVVHVNTDNRAFAVAVNDALAKCKGIYLFVLNNDVIATRGSFSRMIAHLQHDPAAGLISATMNSAGNETSLELPLRYPPENDWIFNYALRISRELRGSRFPIRTVPLCFAATTRRVMEDVGVLDERFHGGMFEDDDWAYRMRLRGHTTVCAEDVFIFHAGRATYRLFGEDMYLHTFNENRNRYESKWGTAWFSYGSYGNPGRRRAATRAAIPELELLLKEYPDRQVVIFPPTIGWAVPLLQRPHHLARKLSEMGFLVFFAVDGSRYDSTRHLEKIAESLYLSNIPHEAFMCLDKPIVFATCYNRQYLQHYRRPIVIYDYFDDLSVFPYDQSLLRMQHRWLLENAQLVLATADTLLEEVRKIRDDVVLCPNAVELRDFAGVETLEMPDDIRRIRDEGMPIVGYAGAISKWLDFELLDRVAELSQEVNFVFIGPALDVSIDDIALFRRKNVRLLGPQEYRNIPRYLSALDAAMIPFRADRIGASTSPLKLYEYLAAGKPVVSTNMRECAKYPEVLLSKDHREFADNVRRALEMARDIPLAPRLKQIAEANTWDIRAKTIVEALVEKKLLDTS